MKFTKWVFNDGPLNRKSRQSIAGAIACGLLICSCASPGIVRLTQPLTDSSLIGDLLSSDKLTPATETYLEER